MTQCMNVALVKQRRGAGARRICSPRRAAALPGDRRCRGRARSSAFDDFARTGLPHRRIEDWKYTDLRALMREVAPLAAAPDQAALARAAKAREGARHRRHAASWCWSTACSRRKLSDLAALEGGAQHPLRCATCWQDTATTVRADLLRPDRADADDRAERGAGDRWRRDRRGRGRRARKAAAHRARGHDTPASRCSRARWCVIGEGRTRHAGRKLRRAEGAKAIRSTTAS